MTKYFLWAFRLAEKETIRLTGLVELGEESILPPLLLQLLEHLALACHLAASFQTSRIWKQTKIVQCASIHEHAAVTNASFTLLYLKKRCSWFIYTHY